MFVFFPLRGIGGILASFISPLNGAMEASEVAVLDRPNMQREAQKPVLRKKGLEAVWFPRQSTALGIETLRLCSTHTDPFTCPITVSFEDQLFPCPMNASGGLLSNPPSNQ
jgi:hypothetical protein